MMIKELFPKFNLPVKFKELDGLSGEFWFKSDCIVLDYSLRKSLPGYSKIVFLHEMMHSTGSDKRLMRIERLINTFDEFAKNSMSYKMEECIAEVACMVATAKLGLLNEYSAKVILHGLETYYTKDMYIPIREVRAAVKYFAADDTDFEEEIEYVKMYLDAHLDMKFQETYSKKKTA